MHHRLEEQPVQKSSRRGVWYTQEREKFFKAGPQVQGAVCIMREKRGCLCPFGDLLLP